MNTSKLDNSNELYVDYKDVDIVIKDKFQDYIKDNYWEHSKKFVILNELIFYSIFVYYYYFGPIDNSLTNFMILKYIVIIFILRYLFSYITTITQKDGKTYFQLNSKIAILAIIILFLTQNTQLNNITTFLLILSYALLSSAAKYGYTVDNILTIMIVYFLITSKLIN